MKLYQLRRAIRQTASLTPEPFTTTPEYDAATLGGLLRYAANELVAKFPDAQAAEVRVLDMPYHDAAPLEWGRGEGSLISVRVKPSRFAVRHDDGPAMNIYVGYADLLHTLFLYRLEPKGKGNRWIARWKSPDARAQNS